MNYRYSFFVIAIVMLIACNNTGSSTIQQEPVSTTAINGEQIFKINCGQCHKPDQDFTGPALKGVETRWKDKETLYAFVRNPQDIVVKNPYAKALFEKWNNVYMQPFPNLTDEEIEAIFDYCNSYQP